MKIDNLEIGCSRVGSLGNTVPLSEIRSTLREAVAEGIRRFDTADIYGQGDSERELGKLIRAGASISVTTKAGFRHGGKADLVRLLKPVLRPLMAFRGALNTVRSVRAEIDSQDFSVDHILGRLRESRARLSLERVNCFLLHDPPVEYLMGSDSVGLVRSLRGSGLAKSIGVSLRDDTGLASLSRLSIDRIQIPVTTYERIHSSVDFRDLVDRGVSVSVRQILSRPDGLRLSLPDAFSRLRDLPPVDSVVVGVSTRKHLEEILRCVR